MNTRGILLSVLLISIFSLPAFSGWSEPVPVTEVNSEYEEWSPFLSFDGLTFYFARIRTSDSYYGRIFEAIRNEPAGPFTTVRELPGEINSLSNGHVFCPWVSCDNLRMYYATQESDIGWKLRFSERTTVNDPWPAGVEITELNRLGRYLYMPRLIGNELVIFFQAVNIPGSIGGHDIWTASRSDKNLPFENVRNLTEINTISNEADPTVLPDGLTMYFTSNRNGPEQLFKVTRISINEHFENIEHLSFFDNPKGNSAHTNITSDGKTLYFVRHNDKNQSIQDIYVSYYLGDKNLYHNKLSTDSFYEILDKDNGND